MRDGGEGGFPFSHTASAYIFKKKKKKEKNRRHVLCRPVQCERTMHERERENGGDSDRDQNEREKERKKGSKEKERSVKKDPTEKPRLTPFLYGASSIASTSKSSAIARVGELSETPRISRPQNFHAACGQEKKRYVRFARVERSSVTRREHDRATATYREPGEAPSPSDRESGSGGTIEIEFAGTIVNAMLRDDR